MAVYAIGDIQGCFGPLQSLLEQLKFNPATDKLWFTGDLVNRGPESVEVLRFVKDLGKGAITVLGNHDLHLLALAYGTKKPNKNDTLDNVLNAPDRDELLNWLANRPLIHHDAALNATLVHAALYPGWDLALAKNLANEVHDVLSGKQLPDFLEHMYGNIPDQWHHALAGWDRLRVITNCFTRLRYCDSDGHMNMEEKGPPGSQPGNFQPWFKYMAADHDFGHTVFGHWSTLGTNYLNNKIICLDDGCLWGGALTAVRLDDTDKQLYSVDCAASLEPWPL
jgi:bis(5'-nucleosyl)-tetraphosphatase (symmetrical)